MKNFNKQSKIYWIWSLVATFIIIAVIIIVGSIENRKDPIVINKNISVNAAINERMTSVIFISDIHAGSPDMSPKRLSDLVTQVNQLQPDLILLGGDYIKASKTGLFSTASNIDSLTALKALKAKYGVVAVLGNHDCMSDQGKAVEQKLKSLDIAVLRNQALLLDGMAILGIDDVIHCNGNMGPAKNDFARQLKALGFDKDEWPYPVLQLSHEPSFVHYAPDYVDLAFAGHTHGGQILPQLTGRLLARYNRIPAVRGFMAVGATPFILTSGVGTSNLPLRVGVPPEIWHVQLKAETN